MDHALRMDRLYRQQRHFYDLTRKYFLFGRDRLVREMDLRPGDQVLEVGCGTARNLEQLARRHPDVRLYGLDASREMLATARRRVARLRLDEPIRLAHGYAEQLDARRTFGLAMPFDAVFFSYALSMMPQWLAALDAALANLRPGRTLYAVDFWDQGAWPRWFQRLLAGWLELFHVRHRPELLERLRELEREGRGTLRLDSIGGRYAYLARFTRQD